MGRKYRHERHIVTPAWIPTHRLPSGGSYAVRRRPAGLGGAWRPRGYLPGCTDGGGTISG